MKRQIHKIVTLVGSTAGRPAVDGIAYEEYKKAVASADKAYKKATKSAYKAYKKGLC